MSDNVTLTERDLSVFSSPLIFLPSRTTFFMTPASTLTNSHNSTTMLVSSLFLSIASVSWDSLIPWIIMVFFSLCALSLISEILQFIDATMSSSQICCDSPFVLNIAEKLFAGR
jgi:hypothetical protein